MSSRGEHGLYRKLLPLVNRFIMLRQGMLSQMYVGRLLEVEAESVQLQTYHSDGSPAAVWTISLNTVTEFVSESRQLDLLALKVKWATSPEELPEDETNPTDDPQLTEPVSEKSPTQ